MNAYICLIIPFQLLGSSPMCDDNPHENISKIYKEEFTRLMQVRKDLQYRLGTTTFSKMALSGATYQKQYIL